MLGEEKRSIINVNLKKYARQIQHHVTDLKMELFAKLLTTVNCELFLQKSTILDVTQILSLPHTTINQCFLRKDLYHRFLGKLLLLPSRYFTYRVQSRQQKH